MFGQPKQSASEEIDIYAETLKTLTHLRDKAEQNIRIGNKDDKDIYVAEYQRYHQEIKLVQLVLSKLLQKVAR